VWRKIRLDHVPPRGLLGMLVLLRGHC